MAAAKPYETPSEALLVFRKTTVTTDASKTHDKDTSISDPKNSDSSCFTWTIAAAGGITAGAVTHNPAAGIGATAVLQHCLTDCCKPSDKLDEPPVESCCFQ